MELPQTPPNPINETRENRLKRMQMRSMRRGIKEMDILLSAFAEAHLADMNEADLQTYDALLHENDQDLYQWVTGQKEAPETFRSMIEKVSQTFDT